MRSTLRRFGDNSGCCFIVPLNVLRTYASDPRLTSQVRSKLQETYMETGRLKAFREAGRLASVAFRQSVAPAFMAGPAVEQQVFDCQNRQSLPWPLSQRPRERGRRSG
jgi:hypothetical protein